MSSVVEIRLTVIIPVYNQEQWLGECLESLMIQRIQSAEFLIINDGSTDGSLNIIRKYLTRDRRFRLINRNNGGYGAAINTGMKNARGKWLGIVESDDVCTPEMYSELMNMTLLDDADMIKASYQEIDRDGRVSGLGNPLYRPPSVQEVFSAGDSPELYIIHQSIWSAVYRRSFLTAHNIRCPETRGGYQDTGFTFALWLSRPRIRWIDKPLYRYRRCREGNTAGSTGNVGAAVATLGYLGDLVCKYDNSAPAVRGLLAIACWHVMRLDKKFLSLYLVNLQSVFMKLQKNCRTSWNAGLYLSRKDRLRYPLITSLIGEDVKSVRNRIRLVRLMKLFYSRSGFLFRFIKKK